MDARTRTGRQTLDLRHLARRTVLARTHDPAAFDRSCGFCGFSPRGLGAIGLIVASHIKPWAVCTDRERLDPRNGIAACPTHDRAFDSGLLTVNGGFRIHRARDPEMRLADRGTDSFVGPGIIQAHLRIAEGGPGPRRRYLDDHRAKVFVQTTTSMDNATTQRTAGECTAAAAPRGRPRR